MMRLFTDFNARTKTGLCWNLVHEGTDLSHVATNVGNRVILFQDEDDFEVEATLVISFVEEMNRDMVVAVPDWTTKRSLALADTGHRGAAS